MKCCKKQTEEFHIEVEAEADAAADAAASVAATGSSERDGCKVPSLVVQSWGEAEV